MFDLSGKRVLVTGASGFVGRHLMRVLAARGGEAIGYGLALQARKVFHVSPFCLVAGSYSMRFMNCSDAAGGRTLARIDHQDEAGPLLQTSVSGQLAPLTRRALHQAWLGSPLLTLGVMARIHWQALHLRWQRVPFFRKPVPPAALVSR